MNGLIAQLLAWPTLGVAVLAFGFVPGVALRLIVLLYPRGNPRRRELLGELYAVLTIERPFWVAAQLELALFEGLRARFRAWRDEQLARSASERAGGAPAMDTRVVWSRGESQPIFTPASTVLIILRTWAGRWSYRADREPVRAENLVHGSDQEGCGLGRSAVMITDYVSAVRVPPGHAGRRVAAVVVARGDVEDRGNPDPAPSARRSAATAAGPGEAQLGGPGLLAALLGAIPRSRHEGLRLLVSPGTILRWHRDIIRRRWAARSLRGRTGRPATRRSIQALVRRLARENPDWGYRRIHGEMAGLGVKVAASTVWQILRASGLQPARRLNGPTWSQFLRFQADAILSCDFFTADLLDGTQAYVLTAIEHATRRIRILGVTVHPTGRMDHPASPQHRPHRALHAAAPLKPLPQPVDLDQYRVRKQARVGGLINEYHLIA